MLSSCAADAPTAVTAELFADLLGRFGSARLRVGGSSMLPALMPGDVVTIEAVDIHKVCAGNIVLFSRDSRFFLHRALELTASADGSVLRTQGDRLHQPDVPVRPEEVLGIVVSILRYGRELPPGRRASLSARLLRLVSRFSDWPAGLLLWCYSRSARAASH